MQRDTVRSGLKITDLCEGDILVMLGPTVWSSLVCCCGRSWGSSHVGQVMRLNGRLWLAEAAPHMSNPNSNFSQWARPGTQPVHDGVCASNLEDSFAYFNAIDIYRPIGITPSDLVKMRTEFLRLYGLPYKPIGTKFVNSCRAIVGCRNVHARYAYDCSDLTYHLFQTIGRVSTDANIRIFSDEFVRPYDIPRVIACNRVGRADGAYAICDPRSFLCVRKTRSFAPTAPTTRTVASTPAGPRENTERTVATIHGDSSGTDRASRQPTNGMNTSHGRHSRTHMRPAYPVIHRI